MIDRYMLRDNNSESERSAEVRVEVGSVRLSGTLTVPGESKAVVLFAHGSGSGRHSPRNRLVAGKLNQDGLATLLFDLLTSEEEQSRANVFDIPMLGARLGAVSEWVSARPGLEGHQVGYFGASTGAGAALWAAAEWTKVFAVVSRGGRPDLAADRLPMVMAPTLLIVGGLDPVVERLNREAQTRLTCESRIEIIPGATHLFEEPGALSRVSQLASEWFTEHTSSSRADKG